MSLEFHRLTVREVIEETADARSFVFEIPEALRARFAYEAGQFLTFEVPWEGFEIRRCYSLASAPHGDEAPKVTVKRVEGGRVSNLMCDTLTAGSTILVSPPDGRFVLDQDAGARPLRLYAGGSGITPVISLLKSALATSERPISLLYANRDRASIIFERELAALAAAHPERLKVHHHIDAERGFLGVDDLRAHLESPAQSDHYVCGPTPFMDAVERALEAEGVDPAHRHFERFSSPLDPDRRPAEAPRIDAVSEVPETFTIKLEGKVHTVPYVRGLTLLASAKKAGVEPPSSCEDGYCGCCMAQRVSGELAMRTCSALTEKEVENGRVLLCQAFPTSAAPVAVDYDATSFKVEPDKRSGTPQPMMPRVLSVLFVVLVMTLFFLFRTRG